MAARLVIGLTGNIGSGKSEAARVLAELGADVIDADQVARDVLAPGSPQVAEVAARFGEQIVHDGVVDRAALGRVVFDDRTALADLEVIVHPATRQRIASRLAESTADIAVIEAIKLLEGPLVEQVDTVWVVTAPADTRFERLVAQRGLPAGDARQRVEAQNPEADKVRRADVVLRNDGTLQDLRQHVRDAWEKVQAEA